MASANSRTLNPPLRLWPGVVIVGLLLFLQYGLPVVWPDAGMIGYLSGFVLAAIGIPLWWLFFSRAPWIERIAAVLLMVLGVIGFRTIVDKSISTGAMGFLFYLVVVPTLSVAFVLWAVMTRNLSVAARRVWMVIAIAAGCAIWMLLRTGGFTGDGDHEWAWRWSETPEERLLAQTKQEAPAPVEGPPAAKPEVSPAPVEEPVAAAEPIERPVEAAPVKPAEWPGFRGPDRDGIIRDVRVQTDWTASPPQEIWRKQIGPGWSSFAVNGNRFYTQEQRGEDEVVSCYSLKSGKPIWRHRDRTRFWESNGGAGPRGTPTLHNGRVYALGATGILNVLNEKDGSLIWSRNAAKDTDTKVPGWGFSSSPLVMEDLVIIATAGQLAAYDRESGAPKWFGPKGGADYSSPHLFASNGTPQILLMSGAGVTSVDLDGKLLWEHKLERGARIVQPARITDADLLISEGDRRGMKRITVENNGKGWAVQERWTSNGLKPYFNDFVVHKDHAYGFDGNMLSCIDLQNGDRKWKGGKYGYGQLVLLADQDVLLVLSEKGELALVQASPEQFTELARFKAIEGKTWNHPVLVRDQLLVRNDREMVSFRLKLAE